MAVGDGLVPITPSSVTYTGTSASIRSAGIVDYSAVTALTLNGIFSTDYLTYVLTFVDSLGTAGYRQVNLTSGGSADTTANYDYQRAIFNGSAVGSRSTNQNELYALRCGSFDDSISTLYVFRPADTTATQFRCVNQTLESSVQLREDAAGHTVSSAFDGLYLYNSTGMSGVVTIYGFEE